MAHEIFISHSTRDKAEADAVCRALEEAGMSCWIAPRDILPGQDWREAIVNAILKCQVFVLIHSPSSNDSKDVAKEISLAANQDKALTVLKYKKAELPEIIQYSAPDEALVDGVNVSRNKRLKELVDTVKPLVNEAGETGNELPDQVPGYTKNASMPAKDRAKSNKKKFLLYSLAGSIALLVGWLLISFFQSDEAPIFTAIAAGYDHSMVVVEKNELYIFGSNNHGQLGLGDKEMRAEPVLIEGLNDVKKISAGRHYNLVLDSDGQLYAFGSNRWGKLGLGDTEDRLAPEKINLPGTVRNISAGSFHSLILMDNGDVYSCGANHNGQLGFGSASNFSTLEPQKIEGINSAVAVAAGDDFSIILLENGDVYTFGNGASGRLGHGNRDSHYAPEKIDEISDVKAIAAGYQHSLLLTGDGNVYSFGMGGNGQLGHGDNTTRTSPTRITTVSNVKAIAANRNQSLIVTDDGQLFTFGSGLNGALGHGSMEDKLRPTRVEGLPPIKAVSAGYLHTIVLCEANRIYSFGDGSDGQLGTGNTENQLVPVAIEFFLSWLE